MNETVESVWQERFTRERQARKEAERILESKSLELYQANEALRLAYEDLEDRVAARTLELADANEKLRREAKLLEEAQKSLRASEAKSRTLAMVASRTNNGVVITDAEGRIEWVNEGFERISEFQLAEVIGRTPGSFLQGPETDQNTVLWIRDCIRRGEGFTTELKNYTKSGHPYIIAIEVRPCRDDEGRLINFMAIEIDVTKQRKAEQDLRESEERFRTLADSAPVMIWMTDLEKRGIYFNRTWLEFTGRNLAEEIRSGWIESIHPEDKARFLDIYEWSFDRRHPFRLEYRLKNADGHYRWLLDTGVPRLTPSGRFEGYIGSCIDITERKHAEETRRQLFALVEHSNDFIAMTTTEVQTFYLNPAGREIVGLEPNQPLVDTRFDDLLTDEGRALFREVWLPKALSQGQFWGEAPLRNLRTGGELPMQHHLFLVHQEGSKRPLCLATISRDVAARIQVETELRRAREAAEDANRAKSAFLANMSHELRTPMAAVVGFGELLMDPTLPVSARDQALKSISRNGRHLMQLIEDILDLSKIEAGRMELELTPYPPGQILDEVRLIMQSRALECGIVLKLRAIGRIPKQIVTDSTRVRQIVLNFVSNAIKFSDRGRLVSITLFCEEEDDPKKARLGFEVEDEGIGMSAEQIERLFQPFLQLDTSPTRRFAGTGLGLSICKRLAEALGGEIRVTSVEHVGSRFTILIPIVAPSGGLSWTKAEEINTQRSAEPPSSAPMRKKLSGRILIAEDSPDLSKLLHYQLTGVGFHVETVTNGRDAITKAMNGRFDMVLMDMQMPILDGYKATRELRDLGYTGPILALTAHAMREDRDRCLQAGCTDYQAKPVDLPTLLETLDRFIPQRTNGQVGAGPKETSSPVENELALVTAPMNDPEFVELIREYVAELTPKLSEIQTAKEKGDLNAVAELAHKIRGSGGMYGFKDLSTQAGRLEDAIRRDPSATKIEEAYEALGNLVREVTREFPPVVG